MNSAHIFLAERFLGAFRKFLFCVSGRPKTHTVLKRPLHSEQAQLHALLAVFSTRWS
jgi:hypothetical protein